MKRTLLVGDVHGCREELEELVAKAGWKPGDDLILVGDLVAKGPDSRGVVQFARAFGARAVLGNHDAHVLRVRDVLTGKLPPGDRAPKPEHVAVVEALSPEDFEYLEKLPLFLRLGAAEPDDIETIAVHAGLVPGVPLEHQRPEDLLNLRSIQDDGTPTKKIKGRPWAALWHGPERVVFGHDAIRGLQLHPFATGLDTGCVYGRKLTGLILPERSFVSVPARRVYVPMDS